MSKEVRRYDCTDGGARFCQGCYTMSECEFGEYVSWDDYESLLAERDALKKALKNLRAATPSLTCESFHHARRDQHDHDEECPPFERWIAAALACNAALQGEQP